tara:strand:- start:121 stop:405 length:285 start_codon:yes stop_codon:yes gene_type:complete
MFVYTHIGIGCHTVNQPPSPWVLRVEAEFDVTIDPVAEPVTHLKTVRLFREDKEIDDSFFSPLEYEGITQIIYGACREEAVNFAQQEYAQYLGD